MTQMQRTSDEAAPHAQGAAPAVLLMVSGGSDSTALLELVAAYARGASGADDPLFDLLAACLPRPRLDALGVLHVNHQLRGAQADADAAFVEARCAALGVACDVRRADIERLAQEQSGGMEAVARAERYRLAGNVLDTLCDKVGVPPRAGIICTAHTLDDRVETFYMRSLVGTGPGGFGSIPRVRARVRRPLLDATREQLRCWLRAAHPGSADAQLWRDDPTNDDGSNFRSRVRTELVPVLRGLRPGFEHTLAQTMDLIADEDEALREQAESLVYRSLEFDGTTAVLPVSVLADHTRPLARRILRCCLLVVVPDARLQAAQIDRVLDGMQQEGFTTETSGGIRVRVEEGRLHCVHAQ